MKATAAQVEPADPHWSIEAKKHAGNSHSTFSACRVQSAICPKLHYAGPNLGPKLEPSGHVGPKLGTMCNSNVGPSQVQVGPCIDPTW